MIPRYASVMVDGGYQCRRHYPESMGATSGVAPWYEGDIVVVRRAGEQ
jgi:hypothetical protein